MKAKRSAKFYWWDSGVCDQSVFYEYIENSIQDPQVQQWCRIAADGDGDIVSVCGCFAGVDKDWFYTYGDCLWEADDEETLLEQSTVYCHTERTPNFIDIKRNKYMYDTITKSTWAI